MQMMVLHSSLLFGETLEGSDRYEDWRLDVDNMTYEVCGFLPLIYGCVLQLGFSQMASVVKIMSHRLWIPGSGSRNYWIWVTE